MKRFEEIEIGCCFKVRTLFGSAGFLKTEDNKAVCTWSKEPTYYRSKPYRFLEMDHVEETECKINF